MSARKCGSAWYINYPRSCNDFLFLCLGGRQLRFPVTSALQCLSALLQNGEHVPLGVHCKSSQNDPSERTQKGYLKLISYSEICQSFSLTVDQHEHIFKLETL